MDGNKQNRINVIKRKKERVINIGFTVRRDSCGEFLSCSEQIQIDGDLMKWFAFSIGLEQCFNYCSFFYFSLMTYWLVKVNFTN